VLNIIQNEKSTLGTKSYSRRADRFQRTTDRQVLVQFPIQKAPSPASQKIVVSESRPTPRRGLNRIEAAHYIGVSPSKFDEVVNDGRMPPPKRIDGRVVWDIRQLDSAFDKLPCDGDDDHNPWDE
jgi:predicted DNA-binding transcriptional regulator AlpA